MDSAEGLRRHAWDLVAAGLTRRGDPARQPVLATQGADGPMARVVVLRGWQGDCAEVHSDAAAAKCADLRADPRASLLFWMPEAQVQLRLSVTCHIEVGAADTWQAVPPEARQAYGGTPLPGQAVAHPGAVALAADPARFAVIRATALRADVLHLGQPHRRVRAERGPEGWISGWVAP